ncbi:uncharacterized protein LOC117300159 [Asterias rubens]|uniref:uncharacterized protein LOC117300159 n=1 Tax=Asterias rubens TaxID=7604 RepID=UPI001454F7EC|nr:uncharacterized protein LOC117300159 [Asterias rubens]
MAKTKVHHRRQVPSNAVYTDDHNDRHNDNNPMNTCDRSDISCKTIIKRIVLVIILAAFVTTLSMVTVVSVRHGPQTILKGVHSFFYTDETTATKHSRATKTVHNVPLETHVPQRKVSHGKTPNSEAKQQKPSKKVFTNGLAGKKNPEVTSKLPAQHQTDAFRETIMRKLKIRDVTVDGRSVIGQELIGNKRRPEAANIRVYQFEHFLSDYECDGLVGAHRNHVTQHSDEPIMCFDSIDTLQRHLKKSHLNIKVTSQDFTEGTSCVNASFSQALQPMLGWSYSTAFYPGETRFTTVFDDRVYRATGLKPSHGGKYQITSYENGIGYKSHTDCTIGNLDLRDRMGTILVYLQDVEEGGQTEFPELGISVTPRKGRAIVWNNQNGDGECDPYSLHVAQPVIKGHKFILQRWYYHKNFYMLGRRPMEPDLPVRKALQPRVSCDEYDHGSCRW